MQQNTHSTVYWVGIDADISDSVKHYFVCTQHKTLQVIQPMMTRDISGGLWEQIVADFFTFDKCEYLLICDTFYKYSFFFESPRKTSEANNAQILADIYPIWPPNIYIMIMDDLSYQKLSLNTSLHKIYNTLPHQTSTFNLMDLWKEI